MSGTTTNPYQTWLGLSVAGRPDCYTLLGLPLYETDPSKIMVAAENALARAAIPMAPQDEPLRQTLVSEIQAARQCLLDPAQKQTYDQQLQAFYQSQTPASSAPQATEAPAAIPIAAPVAVSAAPVVSPTETVNPQVKSELRGVPKSAAATARYRARSSSLSFYGGVVALLLLAGAAGGVYYYVASQQPPQQTAQDSSTPPPDEAPQAAPATEPTPDPDSAAGNTPSGERPSADELANSIGGLGDPDQAMAAMDDGDAMSASPPEATAEEQQLLQQAIEAAWGAINQQSYGEASVALDQVRGLPKTVQGESQFAATDQFVQDLMAFQKGLNDGIQSLSEGEQLLVGSTPLTIHSLPSNRVVIRVAGQSRGYERDKLPEGLKRAIALSRITADDARKKRIEASYLLLSPLAESDYVRDLWVKAGADGDVLTNLEGAKRRYFRMPDAPQGGTPADAELVTGPAMEDAPPQEPLSEEMQAAQQLGNALESARQLLSERQVEQAQVTLSEVASLATLPEHRAKLERLEALVQLNDQFWKAVSEEMGSLPADEELDVNGTLTRIVEATPTRITLRLAGQNRRYTLLDLPPGLAKFLAEQKLGTDQGETHRIVGAFLLVTPQGGPDKAREAWMKAREQGISVDDLMALLSDDYQLVDDLIEQAPVPTESDLAAPAASFMQRWKAPLAAAKRVTEHAELGLQMAAEAKAMPNGSPQQFAAYRYALAEAARGGDFDACTTIIDQWHIRFAIEPGQWHLKAMQLASSSSSATSIHAAITRHALQQIPLLREAGQAEVADAMLKVAQVSVSRARDKELLEAVNQLAGS